MKPELQKKLFDKYPKIFRQKDLSCRQTCMCWGIECDNGWYDLINDLCSMLQFNTDRNNYPQVEAVQVKEKFGTLRFYYNILTSEKDEKYRERNCGVIDGLVSFAEYLSGSICERCGSNKNVKQTEGRWVVTLCEECINNGK